MAETAKALRPASRSGSRASAGPQCGGVPNRLRYDDDDGDVPLDEDDDELDDDADLVENPDAPSDPRQAARAEKAKRMLDGLARRIRSLRERRAMTQEDFASRCGISVSFASLLERGERSPSYETLVTVAEALDVPLADLFKDPSTEQTDDPYHGRLLDFARKVKLSHPQVDRFIAVGHAMFDATPGEAAEAQRRPGPANCTVAGCKKPVLAKGLCTSHYHKARRERG